MFTPITTILKKINEQTKNKTDEKIIYKVRCPKCGKSVIREELNNKGCYVCGFKPISKISLQSILLCFI
ncbi:MAG: hypothetical protein KKA79_09650 [Nanoarchaeota archaeon]|nr:hypothetical protein [Nanoarchaeota archaeon]